MNTSNNNIIEFLEEKYHQIKEYILKHIRIVLPVVVAVVCLVVLVIALSAHNRKVKEEKEAEQAQIEAEQESQLDVDTTVISIPAIPLELNAYPEVDELIKKYYSAMADGDVDIVKQINSFVDDTETIRIQETAKYIEKYQTIDVYTKVGPTDGTYLCYVYSEIKFNDYETVVPGLQALYVCTDENGKLFINDGDETDNVINYIREASLQDDVVDLNNKVAAEYNDMLAEDENLAVFLVDLTGSINTSVGELLAQAEGTESAEEAETEEEETETGITSEVVTRVKTTTTVNVRSSDSETADKLGKAAEGKEFKLIEERGNGWSEIEFEGKSAFVKTEYLEAVGTETVVNVASDNADENNATADNKPADKKTDTTKENKDNDKVSGKVMVNTGVRIRSSASENADKLGTVYAGQELDLIMKQADGWTKVKYNGQVGYVKSEYVE